MVMNLTKKQYQDRLNNFPTRYFVILSILCSILITFNVQRSNYHCIEYHRHTYTDKLQHYVNIIPIVVTIVQRILKQ